MAVDCESIGNVAVITIARLQVKNAIDRLVQERRHGRVALATAVEGAARFAAGERCGGAGV
ncbi:MAG: hypothetical protein IH941_09190 [Acidobacteria bacterium]|nr:hypothetical protein [Acidobacteriota bacterium]